MATEIELKYLIFNELEGSSLTDQEHIRNDVITKVTELLKQKNHTFTTSENLLNNYYFDTASFQFRQHDFGLRVRSKNGQCEQTIKTSGQVIGGLHKRPEYNVDIDKNFPDLCLFPDDIWPKNINVDAWQSNLMVLFSTDFIRYTWLVTYQSSQIEIAFDLGTVSSSGRETHICELELELVSGNESDIFLLAEQLASVLLMRPGIKTKAARGYQLFHNKPVDDSVEYYPLISLSKNSITSVDAFVEGANFCLMHIQQVIDAYFSKPSLVMLEQLSHALLLLRHGCWLFDDLLSNEGNTALSSEEESQTFYQQVIHIRQELTHFLTLFAWVNNAKHLHEIIDSSSTYRNKIEYNQQLVEQLKLEERLFPKKEQVFELLQSKRFNCLQLSIIALLVGDTSNSKTQEGLVFHQHSYAANALEKSLKQLSVDISEEKSILSETYLSYKRLLHRSLLTGSWFGQLFDDKARSDYRAPWLDLIEGITELETLSMLRNQLELISKEDKSVDKLLNWLDRKIENLLIALDATRHIALQVAPYWH